MTSSWHCHIIVGVKSSVRPPHAFSATVSSVRRSPWACVDKHSVCTFGSVTVETLDLRLRDCGFSSRSGRYHAVSTWMGDCPRTGKPSQYTCITNAEINSAFHLSEMNK